MQRFAIFSFMSSFMLLNLCADNVCYRRRCDQRVTVCRQSLGTVTLELPGSVRRQDLETFVHGLLWEKTVPDRRGQPVQILRMKVSPDGRRRRRSIRQPTGPSRSDRPGPRPGRPAERGRERERARHRSPPLSTAHCGPVLSAPINSIHTHLMKDREPTGATIPAVYLMNIKGGIISMGLAGGL